MRGELVLSETGLQEFHEFPMRGVANSADDAHAFMLVLILDRAGFHHGRHAVGPLDLGFLEDLDHGDVDEIDTQGHAIYAALFHLLLDGVGELGNLHGGRATGGALHPGVGIADVFFGDPGRMALDMHPDIALFEEYGCIVTAQQSVAQARFQAIPARCEGAGDVAHILVVHQKHGAQIVGLHLLARAFQAVLAQTVPINTLLPI